MSSKLHPVYVALDSHQYSRAIKLCLALPKDNILGQALLAHAYNKTSQRYKALLVLQSILGEEGFQELQLECKYAKEAWEAENASAGTPQTPAPPAASSKKGKKGKKKPAAPSASAAPLKPAPPSSETARRWSLVDHLDKPPDIDEKWETLPPSESAITDEVSFSAFNWLFLNYYYYSRQIWRVQAHFLVLVLCFVDNFKHTGCHHAKSEAIFNELSAVLLGCF